MGYVVSMILSSAGALALAALIARLIVDRWADIVAALGWDGELRPREVQLSLPFAA